MHSSHHVHIATSGRKLISCCDGNVSTSLTIASEGFMEQANVEMSIKLSSRPALSSGFDYRLRTCCASKQLIDLDHWHTTIGTNRKESFDSGCRGDLARNTQKMPRSILDVVGINQAV